MNFKKVVVVALIVLVVAFGSFIFWGNSRSIEIMPIPEAKQPQDVKEETPEIFAAIKGKLPEIHEYKEHIFIRYDPNSSTVEGYFGKEIYEALEKLETKEFQICIDYLREITEEWCKNNNLKVVDEIKGSGRYSFEFKVEKVQ